MSTYFWHMKMDKDEIDHKIQTDLASLAFWSNKLGCSEEDIINATYSVGFSAHSVIAFLQMNRKIELSQIILDKE